MFTGGSSTLSIFMSISIFAEPFFFFFLMQDILSYAHEIQQLAFNREGFVCKTFCYAALIISLNYILHEWRIGKFNLHWNKYKKMRKWNECSIVKSNVKITWFRSIAGSLTW